MELTLGQLIEQLTAWREAHGGAECNPLVYVTTRAPSEPGGILYLTLTGVESDHDGDCVLRT